MPNPQSTPPPALIPGAEAPARRKRALSWTSAENDFALWLIKTWNETVGPVCGGCYHTRRNNFNAIQLYRRLHAAGRPLFSSDAIRKALAAYAEQARTIDAKFWLTFQGWCHNAEDHISRQLTRLGIPADHDAARKAEALALTEHLGLVREARIAARCGDGLTDHLAAQLIASDRAKPAERREQLYRHYHLLGELARAISKLPAERKRALHKQSCDAFRVAFDRDPNPATREDSAITHALAVAIFDRERAAKPAQEAAR